MGNYNADPDPDTDRIRQVAVFFLLTRFRDLKVDQFSTLTSQKVYSLVNKIGSTRLHVLVNPDEIPQPPV